MLLTRCVYRLITAVCYCYQMLLTGPVHCLIIAGCERNVWNVSSLGARHLRLTANCLVNGMVEKTECRVGGTECRVRVKNSCLETLLDCFGVSLQNSRKITTVIFSKSNRLAIHSFPFETFTDSIINNFFIK